MNNLKDYINTNYSLLNSKKTEPNTNIKTTLAIENPLKNKKNMPVSLHITNFVKDEFAKVKK